MSDANYCHEVFSRAYHDLATGKGDINERLVEAANNIGELHSQDLPDQLRPVFDQLIKDLSIKGDFRHSIATMRKNKAVLLAERISDMESTLREICCEICYQQSFKD
jgi:hypothetical protein